MEQRFAILIVTTLLNQALGAASYSVAPWGDDGAVGSTAAPWRTLAKAASVAGAGDTVQLRQGEYRESLVVQRGGSSAAPVIFKGAPGESAVLCGSDLVSGAWNLQSGKIWRIDGLPATWSVYVDGVELNEARWPNAAVGARMDSGLASADSGTNSTTLVDAALPATNLDGARVRIAGGAAWVWYSRTVQGYGGGKLSFDSSAGGNASYWPKAGNVYVLYRHLALLDAAGEWYQDPVTQRLYVWMPAGDSPSSHRVEIARRKQVATVNGFSYVQLRDLFTFSGAVNFTNSSGSKVVNVHQKHVHTNIDVDGYNYPPTPNQFSGGSGCEWSGGSIEGSWGDGIFISGSGHRIFDMEVHDIARVGTYRGAVRMNGSNHLVEHNSFYDSGRFLIYHGGSKGGALRYNHLYNAGLLTKDLGATYCFQTNGGGMEIAYNHVHDVHCEVGAGIYLDNASADFRVHHNLVHDIDWFALKLNLPSYDNIVVNNTLFATKYWVNAAGSQFAQEMTGTALVNNLYGGGGTAKLITGSLGPSLISNASYTAPPAVFNTGAWTLAAGSPAIDKGTAYAPWTDGYCGSKPDQGCFEYACGTAWSAGDRLTPPVFPYPLSSAGSPSPTATRTQTPWAASPSASPTSTRTASATASPSVTRTATPSVSPSASPTPTWTLSGTPSRTPCVTVSRTATTTASLTGSPSASATATVTASISPSLTASASASASPSRSATPMSSASMTLTPSRTPGETATGSATRSTTPSSTVTASPSLTGTVTARSTASPSQTYSSIPSGTLSPSPSGTQTAAPSASASPAPSRTASATASSTRTPAATVTIGLSATPVPANGPLVVEAAWAFPNPVRGGVLRLKVRLAGDVDGIEARLYSAAYQLIGARESGALPGGWNSWELPLPEGLAAGPCFVVLRARRDGRQGLAWRTSIYVIR